MIKDMQRLGLRSMLRYISKTPFDVVLIKGFALEEKIGKKRYFVDVDLYCSNDFKLLINFLLKNGFQYCEKVLPLLLSHKVSLIGDRGVVEVHSRLFAYYSPFKFTKSIVLNEIVKSSSLNCNVFTNEMSFLYNLIHLMYNHIDEYGRNNTRCDELLMLYDMCDKDKVLSLSLSFNICEWVFIFLKDMDRDVHEISSSVSMHSVYNIRTIMSRSDSMWYKYILLAPWYLKWYAYFDYLFKKYN